MKQKNAVNLYEDLQAEQLRDDFARAALTGWMAQPYKPDLPLEKLAAKAYEIADAMLKERNKYTTN